MSFRVNALLRCYFATLLLSSEKPKQGIEMNEIIKTDVYWVLRYDIKDPALVSRTRLRVMKPFTASYWIHETEQWMTPEEYFIFAMTVDATNYIARYYATVNDFEYQNAEELFYDN